MNADTIANAGIAKINADAFSMKTADPVGSSGYLYDLDPNNMASH
jgi:hypothetical protein